MRKIKSFLKKMSIRYQVASLRRETDKVRRMIEDIEEATKPKRVVKNGKITIE